MQEQRSARRPLEGGRFLAAGKTPDKRESGSLAKGKKITVTLFLRPANPLPSPTPFSYLSREAFLERYAASDEDVRTLTEYLHGFGIKTDVDKTLRVVRATGKPKRLEKAFAIRMAEFRTARGTHRGHHGEASLPGHLGDIVTAIIGLSSGGTRIAPGSATGGANGWGLDVERRKLSTPEALSAYYDFPAATGKGQCVGIIELGGGYRKKDVDKFFRSIDVSPSYRDVLVGKGKNKGINRQVPKRFREVLKEFARWMHGEGRYNQFARPYFEVTMDLSVVGALAPDAEIQMYFGYDTTLALIEIIQEALFRSDPQPTVLSISWGYEEREILFDDSDTAAAHVINELFQCAALMGITVCCAGGDWGGSNQAEDGFPGTGFDVEFPASCPYALAVGGTTVTSSNEEVVWNADFPPKNDKLPSYNFKHGATGGGYSRIFERPAWQKTLHDTDANEHQRQRRAMPDLAALADPQCGMDWIMQSLPVPTGGTSGAAPIIASLVARLNEKLGANVGCLNPVLYELGRSQPELFMDVTRGNNRFSKHDVGFDATPGWDPCTGWGSPRAHALLTALEKLRQG